MGIFNLAPLLRLMHHLQARSLSRMLNPKPLAARFPRSGKHLSPLCHHPGRHEQTLGSQNSTLQTCELERRQALHPALNHLARGLRLRDGDDAIRRKDGVDLAAREDMRLQVADDGLRDFALAFAQRLAGLVHRVVDVLLGRPAQEGVGRQVAHGHCDNGLADIFLSCGILSHDIHGSRGAGGQRDV